MRHLHLLGAGLVAAFSVTFIGAATPSFAATTSLPDVTPVGVVCSGSNCSNLGGSVSGSNNSTDHHKPNKPAHPAKPVKGNKGKHKGESTGPNSKSGLNDILNDTSTSGTGVKWH